MTLSFRDVAPGDESLIARAVRGIAAAERLQHRVLATEADYTRLLFGTPPALHGILALETGQPVGVALWHTIVSTFSGKLGIYLEDVYVDERARGRGIGRAIFAHVARLAMDRGYERVQWWVKNSNTPAVRFYERLGAEPLTEYTVQRLSGDRLAAVAGQW